MHFIEGRSIYLQIVDAICESVLTKDIQAGDRIASVRDMAIKMVVNPNTVIRSYAYLEEQGIISMQRGVGYHLQSDAYDKVIALKQNDFFKTEVPKLQKSMNLLNISSDELLAILKTNVY